MFYILFPEADCLLNDTALVTEAPLIYLQICREVLLNSSITLFWHVHQWYYSHWKTPSTFYTSHAGSVENLPL